MIEVGKIYKINWDDGSHEGHFFLLERLEKNTPYPMCYGICSCGEIDWWNGHHLTPISQTEELKQLFANLLLQQ